MINQTGTEEAEISAQRARNSFSIVGSMREKITESRWWTIFWKILVIGSRRDPQ